jgi:hypothetical protein
MSRWDELSQDSRQRIENGDVAMQWLKGNESIDRWHAAGIASNELQAAAMRACGSPNKPVGKRYNAEWAELAHNVPHLREMASSDRTHAMWLATNWAAITAWLHDGNLVTVHERLRLNHPTTIWRRYNAYLKGPGKVGGETASKAPTARQLLQDKLIAVMDENAALRNLNGQGNGASNATVQIMADTIRNLHAPDYRKRLVIALQRGIDDDERQDQIEAKVKRKSRAKVTVAAD